MCNALTFGAAGTRLEPRLRFAVLGTYSTTRISLNLPTSARQLRLRFAALQRQGEAATAVARLGGGLAAYQLQLEQLQSGYRLPTRGELAARVDRAEAAGAGWFDRLKGEGRGGGRGGGGGGREGTGGEGGGEQARQERQGQAERAKRAKAEQAAREYEGGQ
jgi:hypothetical protein